ncbi:MAG: 7-cyano-7-deazaguanine synthase QueC [Candidatus Omnitrophica bacterium]|nr:7-cyano-7-deazaguanine synthase QueC [Candidatus Omnitrophota bacterium]
MKAVVLLSGGMDSAATLFWAINKGYRCYCLIFDYGQRHRKEILHAKRIAKKTNSEYKIVKLDFPWQGSALLNKKLSLPEKITKGIPVTYVPARNIIFLSIALSWAEAINASAILIGAQSRDFSGYPDCRPEFFRSFNSVMKTGTKTGAEGGKIRILTPLVNLNKTEIVRLGTKLGVPFSETWSCYAGGKKPCLKCAACILRQKAGL